METNFNVFNKLRETDLKKLSKSELSNLADELDKAFDEADAKSTKTTVGEAGKLNQRINDEYATALNNTNRNLWKTMREQQI